MSMQYILYLIMSWSIGWSAGVAMWKGTRADTLFGALALILYLLLNKTPV